MNVEFRIWELTTLLITFFGFVFAAGKILLNQIDRRLSERFSNMERHRERAEASWDEKFKTLLAQQQRDSEHQRRTERELMDFRAEIPTKYISREDSIRNQTVIEAKLDALYNKLEVSQIKGNQHAGKNQA